MNFYDLVTNPFESDSTILEILKLYSVSKESMYKTIVWNGTEPSEDEIKIAIDNFYKHIAAPTAVYYAWVISNTPYDEYNKRVEEYLEANSHGMYDIISFYPLEKYQKLLEKFDGKEIMQRYREKKADFEKYLLEKSRTEKSEEDIKKELSLSDEDIALVEFGRKILSQRDDSKSMGFHIFNIHEGSIDSQIKMYINAGTDTYEFAKKFWIECHKKNIPYQLKVTNPLHNEYGRTDAMCIYTSYDMVAKTIELLRKIKSENPQFAYAQPPLITAKFDNWIGIGSDNVRDRNGVSQSSNSHRARIMKDTIEEVFNGISREEIYDYACRNPQKMQEYITRLKENAVKEGITEENFGIDVQVREELKKIEVPNIDAEDPEL